MPRPVLLLSLLSVPLLASCGSSPDVETAEPANVTLRVDFEEASPPGWLLAATNGRGTQAQWGSTEGFESARGFAVLESENSGQTYNLAILDGFTTRDLGARLRVRAMRGREDQGGGLCWRLVDADNYYVARWNPLENNLRLYHVKEGVRTMLQGARIEADPTAWHELGFEVRGDLIRISFNGRVEIEHRDATFTEPGRIALWTKADACTAFDALRIW